MVSLEQFRKKIKVANVPIGKKGYRMDGKAPKGMRHHAGLGDGGHCCDYLLKNEESFVLIEETQLLETIRGYKKAYFGLSEDTLRALTVRLIRDENRLKVFFSLLVLCRLAANHPEFKQITQAKKCHVWLVVSVPSIGMIALENLEKSMLEDEKNILEDVNKSLHGAFWSSIGKEMENFQFQIVHGEKLESKISEYAPTY
ncbi:MAG: hypothetical protein MPK09_03280 [Gammaproteobacteria bacterium]|nr:hypothetical protein [Gammaproteobacteria bacterium]